MSFYLLEALIDGWRSSDMFWSLLHSRTFALILACLGWGFRVSALLEGDPVQSEPSPQDADTTLLLVPGFLWPWCSSKQGQKGQSCFHPEERILAPQISDFWSEAEETSQRWLRKMSHQSIEAKVQEHLDASLSPIIVLDFIVFQTFLKFMFWVFSASFGCWCHHVQDLVLLYAEDCS